MKQKKGVCQLILNKVKKKLFFVFNKKKSSELNPWESQLLNFCHDLYANYNLIINRLINLIFQIIKCYKNQRINSGSLINIADI